MNDNSKLLQQIQSELSSLRSHSIRRLEGEVRELRRALASTTSIHTGPVELEVYVRNVGGERKPFIFELTGLLENIIRVSHVRAAILLTAILDLQDRSLGGAGVLDSFSTVAKLTKSFKDESLSEEQLDNSVRVAIYRFEAFLDETGLLAESKPQLRFIDKTCSFSLEDNFPITNLNVSISSDDHTIQTAIRGTSSRSPLMELRRKGIANIPPGEEHHDQLLLELFDHKYPVNLVGAFYRPAIQTFPPELLEKMKLSQPRIKRAVAVQNGFKAGRIKFLETLNRNSLREFFNYESGRFTNYPPGIRKDDVLDHLDFIITLVRDEPHYELVLSDAFFPFILGCFEIGSGSAKEHISLFFGPPESHHQMQVGCLAIKNRSIQEEMRSNVLNWLIEHPSSTRDRDILVKELSDIRDKILPLPS